MATATTVGIRPIEKVKSTLYDVWAVVDGKPIAKVNLRRLRRAVAESKAQRLIEEGSPRAYAVRS